jgi:hypothetical protein
MFDAFIQASAAASAIDSERGKPLHHGRGGLDHGLSEIFREEKVRE